MLFLQDTLQAGKSPERGAEKPALCRLLRAAPRCQPPWLPAPGVRWIPAELLTQPGLRVPCTLLQPAPRDPALGLLERGAKGRKRQGAGDSERPGSKAEGRQLHYEQRPRA